jgi:hypothetical protein
MAQNQLRLGSRPQPQLGVMRWPEFEFGDGKTYCASYSPFDVGLLVFLDSSFSCS